MRLQIRLHSLVAAVALIFASSTLAQAIDITFDFTAPTLTTGQTSYTLTSGAYSLYLSNPVNSGFAAGQFNLDSDGIYLDGPRGSTQGFDMEVIGGPLDFKSYTIGWAPPGSGTFSLAGGTGNSTGNILIPVGSYNFNGSYRISPGDTVSLIAGLTSTSQSQIKSITFSTATVPEPSTYALCAIATGVMAAVARRRKARKA